MTTKHSTQDDGPHGAAAPLWRRIWRWIDRRYLHMWLGWPLACGLFFVWLNKDVRELADVGEVARAAPRFERSGRMEYTDVRHRNAALFMDDGTSVRLHCDLLNIDNCLRTHEYRCSAHFEQGARPTAVCPRDYKPPFRGTVRFFDYHGTWLVLAIRREDGVYILDEAESVRSWAVNGRWYGETDLRWWFAGGMLFGLFPAVIWRLKRRKEDRERRQSTIQR